MATDVTHVFLCHPYILCSEESVFCPFLHWVEFKLLYTFWIQVFYQMGDLQIFSQSVAALYLIAKN